MIAMLAFAVPLQAGDPSSAGSTSSPKQALWISDAIGFAEIEGKQILIAFGSPNSEPGGVTFDSSGNFWGTFCQGGGLNTNGLIFELTQKQLLKLKSGGGIKAAKVAFKAPYNTLFDCPSAPEFDSSGNLWILNTGTNFGFPSIIKYSVDQLTTTGEIYPAAVFQSPDFRYLWDMKFDSSGNLWVAGDGVPGVDPEGVFEFTPAQLSGTGPQPIVVAPNLELISGTFYFPGAIAFDQGGNLWVSGYGDTPMLSFAASDLSGSGTISPAASITFNPTATKNGKSGFYQVVTLAFDGKGNLWLSGGESVNGKATSGIAEFKAAQIATSGSALPSLFLRAPRVILDPERLTFGPLL